MIKAVIFDCYGVLVRDGWLPFCEKHFGDNPESLARAHEINHQTDKGFLTYEEYVHELSELAKIDATEVKREIAKNPPNEELFALIRDELKPHYKIGLLSNVAANWLNELFGADKLRLFDEAVLSYQIGVLKPDPRAYEAIADRLGVLPNECIFIDDQPAFCEGAKAYGMEAIVYRDNKDLLSRFKNYNIIEQKR